MNAECDVKIKNMPDENDDNMNSNRTLDTNRSIRCSQSLSSLINRKKNKSLSPVCISNWEKTSLTYDRPLKAEPIVLNLTPTVDKSLE